MNEKRQLDALTGLRFVAAFTVFIHHIGGKFGFQPNGYSIGSLAVTFFFVLSGFILTYVYHDRLNNFGDLKRFAFNRFARIWPLHLVCLLVSSWLLGNGSLTWIFNENRLPVLITNLLLLHSWVPDNDWVFSFNGVSWSISAEAFFYAVFPILIFGGSRKTVSRTVAAIVVVLLAVLASNWASQLNLWELDYYRIGHVNPLVRLPEFCVGVLAGKLFLNRRATERKAAVTLDSGKEILCLGILVASVIYVSDYRLQFLIAASQWGSQFLASWFRVAYPTILFAICIYVFATSRGLVSKFFSLRFMVYLGDISYAFYMIHFIVIRHVNATSLAYGSLNGFQISALAFAIALAASVLLFEIVEMPSRNLLRRIFHGKRNGDSLVRSALGLRFAKLAIAVAIGATAAWVLQQHASNLNRTQQIASVLSKASQQTRSVDFGSLFRLQGCTTTRQEQRLHLQLVWVKRIDGKRLNLHWNSVKRSPENYRRLVFVLDQDDKQIARGVHNQKPFRRAVVGQEFLDDVFVPYSSLKNAASVVVCFREKGEIGLRASMGRRKQRNKQLVLLDHAEIQALLASELNDGID